MVSPGLLCSAVWIAPHAAALCGSSDQESDPWVCGPWKLFHNLLSGLAPRPILLRMLSGAGKDVALRL